MFTSAKGKSCPLIMNTRMILLSATRTPDWNLLTPMKQIVQVTPLRRHVAQSAVRNVRSWA
jgi:hypothetical protein